MSRYYGGWAPYVPVAERRRQAARAMAKLRKNGQPVAPVAIEGRHDRQHVLGQGVVRQPGKLPRLRKPPAARADLCAQRLGDRPADRAGRSHRDGQRVGALQRRRSPSTAVPAAHWQSICTDCAGGIDSLVELLQGRFSKGVMERLCRQAGRVCFRSRRISASPAAAPTTRRCASTSRRCCTASARGSTVSRSCCSGCAPWTRPIWSCMSTRPCRCRSRAGRRPRAGDGRCLRPVRPRHGGAGGAGNRADTRQTSVGAGPQQGADVTEGASCC